MHMVRGARCMLIVYMLNGCVLCDQLVYIVMLRCTVWPGDVHCDLVVYVVISVNLKKY